MSRTRNPTRSVTRTKTLDATALHQPLVVSVAGAIPNHAAQAIVLEPGARLDLNVYNVERCHEVEAFDLLGNQTTLGDACFGSDVPSSSTGGQSGQPTSPEGSNDGEGEPRLLPEPGGCAVSGPTRRGSLWWVVGGGLACAVMRRRMAGKVGA